MLQKAKDACGRRLKIHKLLQPGPLYMTEAEAGGIEYSTGSKPRRAGERLAGSYVNFYIANRHIVMPLLDARTDRAARAALAKLFPRRKVIGVPSREILLGGGNIHCITQQQPRGGSKGTFTFNRSRIANAHLVESERPLQILTPPREKEDAGNDEYDAGDAPGVERAHGKSEQAVVIEREGRGHLSRDQQGQKRCAAHRTEQRRRGDVEPAENSGGPGPPGFRRPG